MATPISVPTTTKAAMTAMFLAFMLGLAMFCRPAQNFETVLCSRPSVDATGGLSTGKSNYFVASISQSRILAASVGVKTNLVVE